MLSTAFEDAISTNGAVPVAAPQAWVDPIQIDAAEASELEPLRVVRMSEVEPEEVQWIWDQFLPAGAFCLMEGPEGLGKTFISCALACAVPYGGQGLPGTIAKPELAGNVLIASAEDSLSFVLRPRLDAMNAPIDHIFALDEPFTLDKTGVARLTLAMREYQPRLLIVDPLFSYTGKVNLNNDNEIRSITDELKRLAETFKCTILGIRHIGKNKGLGDARNAGLNGVGWRASARSCLLVGQDPDNQDVRAICQTKSNFGPVSKTVYGYEIRNGQFLWTGPSSLTAETMLSFSRSETTEERGERQDAMTFLKDYLSKGRQGAKDVQSAARKNGISDATLRRAKTALGVKSVKSDLTNGVWYWELP